MSYKAKLLILCSVMVAPLNLSAENPPPSPSATVPPVPSPSKSPAPQPKSIDQQIEQMREERDRCKLRAALAGRKADQLMTRDWLGYRRAIRVQEMNEERMKALDEQIKTLEQKKKPSPAQK